jgi:hypothetical protein
LTISDLETIIERGLESLRNAPLSETITASFPYILPPGMRVRVQLEEDGRKKRSTAAANNWNPATGEIVLYFEPVDDVPAQTHVSGAHKDAWKTSAAVEHDSSAPSSVNASSSVLARSSGSADGASGEVTPAQVRQCCDLLAEAERAGKAFVALKWFRDEAVPKSGLPWTTTADSRQRVLAMAIEQGMINTSRIPNPKAPQHPTTTVALNKAEFGKETSSRFKPITVRGEPVSYTIMRERGSL